MSHFPNLFLCHFETSFQLIDLAITIPQLTCVVKGLFRGDFAVRPEAQGRGAHCRVAAILLHIIPQLVLF
jgi:hypothetical protein